MTNLYVIFGNGEHELVRGKTQATGAFEALKTEETIPRVIMINSTTDVTGDFE